jgi:translocation and assembly module TamB
LLEDQSLKVKGTFRAGDGYGEIESAADYRDAVAGIKLRVRGNKLKVISVPDLTAIADINVGVEFRGDELTLDGEVLVPWARVTPRDISARKVSESPDVVIVKGELPESSLVRKESILKMFGEMRVAFGDDVNIKLDLAEAQLTGAAVFRWSGDIMPKAQGRYDITGDIAAYGQSLKVVEGAVRFSQVPADNPEIRIRAEREIFGNSQVKQAGVLVAGTAKRPTLQAYTVPMTTEERALTLLVTGSDFNFEQGVGAIDFGTYIAPRLFVSYGIGLFDQENVISARYDLARGFGIKATSGQNESGLDFIYRVER